MQIRLKIIKSSQQHQNLIFKAYQKKVLPNYDNLLEALLSYSCFS